MPHEWSPTEKAVYAAFSRLVGVKWRSVDLGRGRTIKK